MRTGVRWWYSGFWNGAVLGAFPGGGEICKHQNMFKKSGEVDESFAGDISKHNKVRYRLFPGADLTVRDVIRRRSLFGFI